MAEARNGRDYDMKTIEIDDYNPDLKSVSKEVIVGPKNKVMKDIETLNSQYLTRPWIYGNRSRLPILKPLGITEAFNWKRGYKQTIIEAIRSRFDQYGKVNGSLDLLLNRRPQRMEWDKKQFIKSLILIDQQLRDLRGQGVNFGNQVEKAMESINEIKLILKKQYKAVEEFIENSEWKDKVELNMYITFPEVKDGWIETMNLSKHAKEVIKWQCSKLVFEVWYKESNIQVQSNGGNILGQVPLKPYGLSFGLKLEEYINLIQTKGDLQNINATNFQRRHYGYSRTYSDLAGMRAESNNNSYNWDAHWPSKRIESVIPNGETNDYSDNYELLHPFLHKGSRSYSSRGSNGVTMFHKWVEQEDLAKTGICFGNLETEITEHLVKLDLVGLFITLTLWKRYEMGSTGPLNHISKSFHGMPSQYSNEFSMAVGKNLIDNALMMTGNIVSQDVIINGCTTSWLSPRFLEPRRAELIANHKPSLEEMNKRAIYQANYSDGGGRRYSGLDDFFTVENLYWLSSDSYPEINREIQFEDALNEDEEIEMRVMNWDIFDPKWTLNVKVFHRSTYSKEMFNDDEGDYCDYYDKASDMHKEIAISFAYAYVEYADNIECQLREKCYWYQSLNYMIKKLEGEIPVDAVSFAESLAINKAEMDVVEVAPDPELLPFDEGYEDATQVYERLADEAMEEESIANEQHNDDMDQENEIANQMRTWVSALRGGNNG